MSRKVINEYGTARWYNEQGQLHREGGPALEYANGHKAWFLNDKLHREGGPAIECADGTKYWYLNDMEHSESEYKIKLKGLKCERKLKRQNNV